MPIRSIRPHAVPLACFVLLTWMLAAAQANPRGQNTEGQNHRVSGPTSSGEDYSGMYSFLRDGEFVQLTVEARQHVTGFVSRFGDAEGDRGVFLDHFFESGKLDGKQLTFTTKTVNGVSFEFRGTLERGDGKNRGDEAYYVLQGSLIQSTTDETKKTSSRSREVALKSFPQDLSAGDKK